MYVSHLQSGYYDTTLRSICLTFRCVYGIQYCMIDVWLKNTRSFPFAKQQIAITDENGDTTFKHYIPIEIRRAVEKMFRQDEQVIKKVMSEKGL